MKLITPTDIDDFETTCLRMQRDSETVKSVCDLARGRVLGHFDKISADRMADEIDVLISRKIIDSRSPAADALLDYRDPPRSDRSDRLAVLEKKIEKLKRLADGYDNYGPEDGGNHTYVVVAIELKKILNS